MCGIEEYVGPNPMHLPVPEGSLDINVINKFTELIHPENNKE